MSYTKINYKEFLEDALAFAYIELTENRGIITESHDFSCYDVNDHYGKLSEVIEETAHKNSVLNPEFKTKISDYVYETGAEYFEDNPDYNDVFIEERIIPLIIQYADNNGIKLVLENGTELYADDWHSFFDACDYNCANDDINDFVSTVYDYQFNPSHLYSRNMNVNIITNYEGKTSEGNILRDDQTDYINGTWLKPFLLSQGIESDLVYDELRHIAHKYNDVVLTDIDYSDELVEERELALAEALEKHPVLYSLHKELLENSWDRKVLCISTVMSFDDLSNIIQGNVEYITIDNECKIGVFDHIDGTGGQFKIALDRELNIKPEDIKTIQIEGSNGTNKKNPFYNTIERWCSVGYTCDLSDRFWTGRPKIKLKGE